MSKGEWKLPTVAIVSFYTDGHHIPYLQDLVHGLKAAGVELVVIGSENLGSQLACKVVELRAARRLVGKTGVSRQVLAIPLMISALRAGKAAGADVVHFAYADWHLPAIVVALHLAGSGVKPVLTVHWARGVGAGPALGCRQVLRSGIYKRFARSLMRRFGARWIVHHAVVAEQIKRLVPNAGVFIAPYPTRAPKRATRTRAETRRDLRLTCADTVLLCFGGTRWDKGADLALLCLKKLPSSYKLIVAGQPQHFSARFLTEEAKRLDVIGQVRLIPRFISDAEAASLFEACDYGFFPYRREFSGQSGPLLQLAAHGKLVAAADLPVLGETVRTAQLGVVFPVEDIAAMVMAVQALDTWKPRSSNRRTVLEKHGVSAFAQAVRDAYKSR